MIMLLNWLLSIITFGTFSLATITMTNVDEYTYETQDGITLVQLFGDESLNLIDVPLFDDTIPINWSSYTNSAVSSFSIVDEELKVITDGIGEDSYVYYATNTFIEEDHYYYIIADMKTDVSGADYLAVQMNGESEAEYFATPSSGTWDTLQYYMYYDNHVSNWLLFKLNRTSDTSTTNFYIDNAYMYDLSDIYGLGNEPTESQMDTWYGLYKTALTTDQHEYTYTLNTIDLEDIVVLVSSAFMWYVAIKLFREVI